MGKGKYIFHFEGERGILVGEILNDLLRVFPLFLNGCIVLLCGLHCLKSYKIPIYIPTHISHSIAASTPSPLSAE
jgi:hypothetical protein